MPDIRFDLFQVITIAAIINSLIFSVLLLRKKENQAANYFLSLLLFSIGYSLATQLCIDLGVYNYYPWLHWLPAKLSYWIGPALYFYVKALTSQPFVFKKAYLWHFAWLILEYPHSIYHLQYDSIITSLFIGVIYCLSIGGLIPSPLSLNRAVF